MQCSLREETDWTSLQNKLKINITKEIIKVGSEINEIGNRRIIESTKPTKLTKLVL